MPEKLGAFASHQVSRSYTSGATRIRRTARRSLTDSPSLSRSTSKIASILTTSKGRDEGRFCAPGSDIGEHEELALTMQPAGGLHDRSLDDNLLHRAVKAGVGIGREDSRISAEMAFEVRRSGRANKYRSRGITAPRTSCNIGSTVDSCVSIAWPAPAPLYRRRARGCRRSRGHGASLQRRAVEALLRMSVWPVVSHTLDAGRSRIYRVSSASAKRPQALALTLRRSIRPWRRTPSTAGSKASIATRRICELATRRPACPRARACTPTGATI